MKSNSRSYDKLCFFIQMPKKGETNKKQNITWLCKSIAAQWIFVLPNELPLSEPIHRNEGCMLNFQLPQLWLVIVWLKSLSKLSNLDGSGRDGDMKREKGVMLLRNKIEINIGLLLLMPAKCKQQQQHNYTELRRDMILEASFAAYAWKKKLTVQSSECRVPGWHLNCFMFSTIQELLPLT